MQVRNKLRQSVKKAVKNLQEKGKFPVGSFVNIKIERPQREGQGDYATSIAMQIASHAGRKPKTIAKILAEELKTNEFVAKIFEDTLVAPPGFINFYFKKEYLGKFLSDLSKDEKLGVLNLGKDKKINFEFISVNPTGELHVGHGRGAFYGDVLARILSFVGFKVVREYYINNARQSAQIKELGKTALGRGTSYKSPYLDEKLHQYAKALRRTKSPESAGYFLAGKIQNDIEKFLAKKAKIKFDIWTEEEELYKKNKIEKVLNELKDMNLTYEKDGATWLDNKKHGDNQDQVLIRQNGESTYFLADIAYHIYKTERNADKLIDIWGADHQGHVKRIMVALGVFGIKDVEILITQLVRLKGKLKLSKRKGNAVSLEDLIDDIGIDAARYFYLTKSLNTQMEIDLKLAREQSQKNPVFYIQYTHARICSILRKSRGTTTKLKTNSKILAELKDGGELNLVKKLLMFPDIIEDIAQDYQIHRLTGYLHELAQEFNKFYTEFRVIENDKINMARLALVTTAGLVIKRSLDILGISAPKKM